MSLFNQLKSTGINVVKLRIGNREVSTITVKGQNLEDVINNLAREFAKVCNIELSEPEAITGTTLERPMEEAEPEDCGEVLLEEDFKKLWGPDYPEETHG